MSHITPTPSNDDQQVGSPTYRAYHFDGSGKVRSAVLLEAASDAEARAIAASIPNVYGLDLWDRGRFLDRFPPLSLGTWVSWPARSAS